MAKVFEISGLPFRSPATWTRKYVHDHFDALIGFYNTNPDPLLLSNMENEMTALHSLDLGEPPAGIPERWI